MPSQRLRTLVDLINEPEAAPLNGDASSGEVCSVCSHEKTVNEVFYLSDRCSACETVWHERIKAWKSGAHDPGLDAGRFLGMPGVH